MPHYKKINKNRRLAADLSPLRIADCLQMELQSLSLSRNQMSFSRMPRGHSCPLQAVGKFEVGTMEGELALSARR